MEGRRRSGILSRRNRSKWKLRHDSQGAIRRLCFTDILFLSLSSFRSSLVGTYGVKKKGRRAGITSRTGAETIVCTLRAFDFSRRNDYAIISRRVPFLLKRKTSPPSGPPWPLCNIGRLSRSRSLAKVSLSVSLIQSALHPFVTIRADVPSSECALPTNWSTTPHATYALRPDERVLTPVSESIFIIEISPRVYIVGSIPFCFLLVVLHEGVKLTQCPFSRMRVYFIFILIFLLILDFILVFQVDRLWYFWIAMVPACLWIKSWNCLSKLFDVVSFLSVEICLKYAYAISLRYFTTVWACSTVVSLKGK